MLVGDILLLLSTPFWEFPEKTPLAVGELEERLTFYSLLGVSCSRKISFDSRKIQ